VRRSAAGVAVAVGLSAGRSPQAKDFEQGDNSHPDPQHGPGVVS